MSRISFADGGAVLHDLDFVGEVVVLDGVAEPAGMIAAEALRRGPSLS
jgi:hypothetical protein